MIEPAGERAPDHAPDQPSEHAPDQPSEHAPDQISGAERPPVAWVPVAALALGVTALLLALAGRYDYHRDELYFRMLGQHPAWGYVDQPPLTPLLARLAIELFGDTVWGLRVPAALAVGITVLLLALVAREVGGGAAAQLLAACGVLSGFAFTAGHTFVTSSPDLVIWLLVILFVMRALLRERPRYWLAAGLVAGLGLYNKHLVILLLLGIGLGLLIAGPRRVLRSGWLWAGVALAALVGAPNLVYQVVNDFPQVRMASALAEHEGGEARQLLLPMQLILVGPLLVPIWVAGIVALLRRRQLRPVRALAVAYLAICVLLLALAAHFYYAVGLLLALYAIGCVSTVRWSAGRRVAAGLVGAAVAANVLVSALMALPLLPERALAGTPIPAINQTIRDQIGWQAYVRQIADGYRAMPAGDRAHAVIITGNYGEAGAVDRYGPRYGLPTVYSGQNELYHLRRPPESATAAVIVFQGGDSEIDPFLAGLFEQCRVVAELRNDHGVDNEEEGTKVRACTGRRLSWSAVWPLLQHID